MKFLRLRAVLRLKTNIVFLIFKKTSYHAYSLFFLSILLVVPVSRLLSVTKTKFIALQSSRNCLDLQLATKMRALVTGLFRPYVLRTPRIFVCINIYVIYFSI